MKILSNTFLKYMLALLMVSMFSLGCVSSDNSTKGETNMETKGNYVNVNGLNMYYEIHGTGQHQFAHDLRMPDGNL